jgi:hypothetical protein
MMYKQVTPKEGYNYRGLFRLLTNQFPYPDPTEGYNDEGYFYRYFKSVEDYYSYAAEYTFAVAHVEIKFCPEGWMFPLTVKWWSPANAWSWNMTYQNQAEWDSVQTGTKTLGLTYTILPNSPKSLGDTTAASGHSQKKEENKMSNMFNNSPVTSNVQVKEVAPPPAPVPPSTFTLTFEGLTSTEVAQIRKVLDNTSGVPVAKRIAAEILAKTGNSGRFYSKLRVDSKGYFSPK